MNPDTNPNIGNSLPLPQPLPEVPQAAVDPERPTEAPYGAVQPVVPLVTPPMAPNPLAGGVDPAVPSIAATAPAPSAVQSPAVADDGDKIEAAWVAKVKAILRQTKSNPYQQNQQMALLRADYLQKRYHKTIKVN
jgi:hypothetical protein